MTLVNIKQAAELAGLSRQQLYREYLDTGKVSVDRSEPKKPKIDTSELLRVFGELHKPCHMDTAQLDTDVTPGDTSWAPQNTRTDDMGLRLELERLKTENEGLKAVLVERQERLLERERQLADMATEKTYHQNRIETLEGRWDRLLENRSQKKTPIEKLLQLFRSE